LVDADLVLVVRDAAQALTDEDSELLAQVEGRLAIVVQNKIDIAGPNSGAPAATLSTVKTSALTGEGIADLRAEILRQVGGDSGVQAETGFLTNVRHLGLVRDALSALTAAQNAVNTRVPHEMLLLDLYNALRPLDEITGATTNDDILNLIFSTFCIGK